MPWKDLRDFLNFLEERDLLSKVKVEVDPEWEINGISTKLFRERGPAVLFEKVKGSKFPLVTGVIGTLERRALALGTTPEKEREEWLMKVRSPIPPKKVRTGPCKENILRSDKVDLTALPRVKWHKEDGGPYIGTLGCVITKDPETGAVNAGIYRMMLLSKNKTTILAPSGYTHAGMHYKKHEMGGKPMQMAVAIGVDPVLLVMAATRFNHPPDEFSYAGGFRGRPLDIVDGETVDLPIPATAEIVLEGEVQPKERVSCGPFGEYTGFLANPMKTPIFRVKAVTHRDNAIFQATREGGPPNESLYLVQPGTSYTFYKLMKNVVGVKDASLAYDFYYIAVVSIKKLFTGHPRFIMNAAWGVDNVVSSYIKMVIVTDDFIDIKDPIQVNWAIATTVQPDRDIVTIPGCHGVVLDPSQPPSRRGITARIGIDATVKTELYETENEKVTLCDDPDVRSRVEAKWDTYGIKGLSMPKSS